MDSDLKNRQAQPRARATETQEAPPVAVPSRVMPCVCPLCGKAQAPRLLRTKPDRGEAHVECSACAGRFIYIYATAANPVPRVRFGVVDSTP